MPSWRPTPWANSNDPDLASLASAALRFNGIDGPHVYLEQHTDYLKITNCDTKCDVCKQRTTTSIQKCGLCTHKTCLQCHLNRQYDDQHILSNLELDWGFIDVKGRRWEPIDPAILSEDGQRSQESNQRKTQNFGLGNGSPAGSPIAERVAFEPTAENYHDMSTYCEQMGRHQDAKQYAHMAKHRVRMDRSAALKGGGQYIQNAEATSVVVKTNAKAQMPFRASQEEMISSRSSSENQFAPGSLEGGKTVPEEKPYETENSRCPFSIPVVHQPEVRQPKARLRGIAVNNEATPDAKGFYGYGQSPTNTSPYEVKWNYEAFPCADQGLMAKVLIEGGQSTMKLSRTGPSNDAYPLLLYDAATSKALLKQDQWAIDNPTEFELQWAFVEKLILDWHRDLRLRLEKLRSGELKALEMLEGAFSLRAMVQGIPQGSFWVFWVVGMRQALQGPVFN
ncbi:hypothetical protein CHU98_g12139 [Xylaria longipes]|nr:hypothetical protein CHU98_g12139 [Xylaria longipes]